MTTSKAQALPDFEEDESLSPPPLVATGPERRVWAVGGGKGGIGKTIITSNIAVFLSWMNKRVSVIDLDLGGANLHTSLGVEANGHTLNDVVTGRVDSFQKALQPTSIRNLSIVSGAQDPAGFANLASQDKANLVRQLRQLDSDYILLDLGAGTATHTLDFFLCADEKIVVVTPEPTSIENAYRFIKSAFFRMLRACATNAEIRSMITEALSSRPTPRIRSPKDLLTEIQRTFPEVGRDLVRKMSQLEVSLIVNQVRMPSEAGIGKAVCLVGERYFGIKVNLLGYVPYDNAIWQSIRHKAPFLIDAPNSAAVTHLEDIVRQLLKTKA